jgi:Carbamoyl-phosphate synthase L chain, ATP binding domain
MSGLVAIYGTNPVKLLTSRGWADVLATAAELDAELVAVFPGGAPSRHPWPRVLPQVHWLRGPEVSAAELGSLLHVLSPDCAFCLSDPDSATRRDAVAVGMLGTPWARRLRTAIERGLHKGLTRDACSVCNVPVANGVWGRASDLCSKLPWSRSGRFVVRSVDQWAGRGVTFHASAYAVATELASRRGVVAVEEFRVGEEISIEVVATLDRIVILGWVLKGPAGSPTHPLLRLRFAPMSRPPRYLADAAVRLVRALDLTGVIEVEFIVQDSNDWCVTEVNPRASGITSILFAANGMSSISAALRLAAGQVVEQSSDRAVCQLSLRHGARTTEQSLKRLMTLFHVHPSMNAHPPSCLLTASDIEELRHDLHLLLPLSQHVSHNDLDRRLEAVSRLACSPGLRRASRGYFRRDGQAARASDERAT